MVARTWSRACYSGSATPAETAMPASLARRPPVLAALLLLTVAAGIMGTRLGATSPLPAPDAVTVVNTPDVRLTSVSDGVLRDLRRAAFTPSFVRAKKRYAFTWNPGEAAQTYVVVAVQDDGWIGVVTSTSPQPELVIVSDPREILWINVTRAFSIQEVIP
jgi:hypothetical protein